MLKEQLRDILKHTHGLPFIDSVKIIGEDGGIRIESIDEDQTVVLFGKLKKNIEQLDGHTIGLSRMGILSGYLNFPLFDTDEAEIDIPLNHKDEPHEITFNSNNGHRSSYRMMNEMMADKLIKVPPFKGVPWHVEIEPTKQNLDELKYFSGILSSQNPLFSVAVVDGDLVFELGAGTDSQTTVPFARGVDGNLSHTWSFPLAQVLAILKLSDPAICTMSFSDHGALKISIDSGIGEYDYIIPPKG